MKIGKQNKEDNTHASIDTNGTLSVTVGKATVKFKLSPDNIDSLGGDLWCYKMEEEKNVD